MPVGSVLGETAAVQDRRQAPAGEYSMERWSAARGPDVSMLSFKYVVEQFRPRYPWGARFDRTVRMELVVLVLSSESGGRAEAMLRLAHARVRY